MDSHGIDYSVLGQSSDPYVIQPRGVQPTMRPNARLSERKRNATDSDVRRMYIRGMKGALKLKVLPLEEALTQATVSPTLKPAKKKPLGPPKQEIVVIPGAYAAPKPGSKSWQKKKSRSIGSAHSGSLLRNPKIQKKAVPSPEPSKVDASRRDVSKSKLVTPSRKSKQVRSAKNLKPDRYASVKSRYDGQPMFEDGVRVVQGGLPELGRR